MFNSWLEFYVYFSVITAIVSLYKLYIPCWKQIKKENDAAAKKIRTRPVITGIVFSIAAFVLAPMFFVLVMFDDHADRFVKGFVKGNLGK
jgi:hypothetical protein